MRKVRDFVSERNKLVNDLTQDGVIKSKEVSRAMLTVPRDEFVYPDTKYMAYHDQPLPLGNSGQTISAPHMIAIMLEELELSQNMKILEIGTGSGYNVALIAEIIKPTKSYSETEIHIITIERIQELLDFAKNNLIRTGYSDRIKVVLGDGTLGYPNRNENMLYDRIIVTAASPHIPRYLKAQLKIGGVLLAPIGDLFMQTLIKATKQSMDNIIIQREVGCMFVPLIGEDGYK
ncbi:MAG: protein-L-isoaspartate(D-aspartate) O-methyltransferase [Nitrososphaeraceae archaeon]|nr:protein-L-isoaspartate(D-aspartate) O-methyltransferase [Nitrososphaeraceae archaeon]